METVLVVIIVSAVAVWACRASYRMFTGKGGGCNCSGSCSKKGCSEFTDDCAEKFDMKN